MMWLGAAFLAAIFWGISYAAVEHSLKNGVSMFTMMMVYSLLGLPIFGGLALYDGTLKQGIALFRKNPPMLGWLLLAIILYALGNVLVLWAVKQKDATAVSLIEISYPLFVALFTYLLFNVNHLTLGTIIGGALIFAGVAVMYLMA